ncbi:hypothetical protein [Microbulbifer sp. SAOS-129_SWC]|uniref:hypothetical protein n=1 Tax=Microbulbifer sp. SAOS-129_SWC TaxID=3145235 RepID=UPI003217FAEA
MHSYDAYIDATVVSLNDLLQRPISSETRENAVKFLSRAKKLREYHSSTAKDMKYYKKSIDILNNLESSKEDSLGEKESIRERLKELRRLSESDRAN